MKRMIVENIDTIFTFGKHKGKPLKDVSLIDPNYIEWLCKEVESFIINDDKIDQLNEYCLSEFFRDPESYLNEKGNFTLSSFQHLKYQGRELVLGQLSINEQINMLTNDIAKGTNNYKTFRFTRKVFDGETCKKLLLTRIKQDEAEIKDKFDNNYNDDYNDQTDWSHYNDDLDMDQQSPEFWNQF